MKLLTRFAIPFLAMIAMIIPSFAQENEENNAKPVSVEDIKAKQDATDETVSGLVSDVTGLKKLKITGYFQLEAQKTESAAGFGSDPYNSADKIQGRFRVRRGRIKFNYNAGITEYVFQGDFTNEGFTMKDFYLKVTDPWTKMFALQAGVFNRPVYEVEYSSSQRESMERSNVILALYPKERDLGAMLTFHDDDLFKLQVAAFNNTYKGDLSQFMPNFNASPLYYMARITKSLDFKDLGLSIDFGAHARIGSLIANTNKIYASEEAPLLKVDSVTSYGRIDSTTYKKGDAIPRTWFGGEAQIYWDFLGGMKLMGEYIMGANTDEPSADGSKPIRVRNFSGYYIYFVKNITNEWQFALKYDSYNPNTKINSSKIDNTADLTINTFGLGIHNYTFPNVRISLWYDMPKTQISNNKIDSKGTLLMPKDPVDNLLTLRFQYKF